MQKDTHRRRGYGVWGQPYLSSNKARVCIRLLLGVVTWEDAHAELSCSSVEDFMQEVERANWEGAGPGTSQGLSSERACTEMLFARKGYKKGLCEGSVMRTYLASNLC